jgi:hypothetical protein
MGPQTMIMASKQPAAGPKMARRAEAISLFSGHECSHARPPPESAHGVLIRAGPFGFP